VLIKKKGHDGGGPPIALRAPKLEGFVGFFPPRYMVSPLLILWMIKKDVRLKLWSEIADLFTGKYY
jgi:hypothetical protein